jgi:transcription initiation factor IIE alpha subunit
LGLQDVAREISHYTTTQEALVRTIKAIGPGKATFIELRKKTGFKDRYMRYMITLLRSRGIVKGERGREYRYQLTPDAYLQHVKVKLGKAVENAAKGREE